jgi:hypothetical protein
VADHAVRCEQVDGFDDLLVGAERQPRAGRVQQNSTAPHLGGVAIAAVPTMIAGIYGRRHHAGAALVVRLPGRAGVMAVAY